MDTNNTRGDSGPHIVQNPYTLSTTLERPLLFRPLLVCTRYCADLQVKLRLRKQPKVFSELDLCGLVSSVRASAILECWCGYRAVKTVRAAVRSFRVSGLGFLVQSFSAALPSSQVSIKLSCPSSKSAQQPSNISRNI